MNCGIYTQPVPSERAVHNPEHGAVWITYQPSLPQSKVSRQPGVRGQAAKVSPGGAPASRYMDPTRTRGCPRRSSSPLGVPAAGRLAVRPRLQQFVDKFRASPTFTPEYGGECTGGVGTPQQT
jgi:hypothetical protein